MDMETLKIRGDIADAVLHYSYDLTSANTEFAILHKVEIGKLFKTEVDLDKTTFDNESDREHFEQLLTDNTSLTCYRSKAEAEADLANWHEDYMEGV